MLELRQLPHYFGSIFFAVWSPPISIAVMKKIKSLELNFTDR